MADVIRQLRENETGLFMPDRELLEPAASEVALAVAKFIGSLVDQGIKDGAGEVLVAVDDSTRVASPFVFHVGE